MQLINVMLIIVCIWLGVSALGGVIALVLLRLEWISDLAWDVKLRRKIREKEK